VPHWPAEWGGGWSTAEQVVLYQELAAHDAPRLVLAFVGIHHAAATLLAAGTHEQRQRHLSAILEGEVWCQGFSEPDAGSDLASLTTSARRTGSGSGAGDRYLVTGQKVWASGALHADWCLLLARTDPAAPKRHGISYFLLDMRSPGIEVRPIRQATGESHFCEMFLDDVAIPAGHLVGAENAGWQVAQATLGAERGMTMLELAERLGHGFRWLVEACAAGGLLDDPVVQDRLAVFETEVTGLRALCRGLVEGVDAGTAGPADASIAKLFYSELLQRMTGFGAEITGLAAHTELEKPRSSGWESGRWMLDFIGSWEWTIPGGTSEIQRSIIGERGLGLPREPVAQR
jgi:alkylation response protein AidB-like acyl-CoA dehydrogenase